MFTTAATTTTTNTIMSMIRFVAKERFLVLTLATRTYAKQYLIEREREREHKFGLTGRQIACGNYGATSSDAIFLIYKVNKSLQYHIPPHAITFTMGKAWEGGKKTS